MPLSEMQLIVLAAVHKDRVAHIPSMSEPWRQEVITLGMMEPPLVEAMGDVVVTTDQGEAALRAAKMI